MFNLNRACCGISAFDFMKTIFKIFFVALVFATAFSSCGKEKETVIVIQNGGNESEDPNGNGGEAATGIIGTKWIRVEDENEYIQFQTATAGILVDGSESETFHFTYTYVEPEGTMSGYEDEENRMGYYEMSFTIENNYLYVHDLSKDYTYIRN